MSYIKRYVSNLVSRWICLRLGSSPFESFIFLSSNWTACSRGVLSSLVLFKLFPLFSRLYLNLLLWFLLLLALLFESKRSLLSPCYIIDDVWDFVSIFSSLILFKSSSNRGAASAKGASSPLLDHLSFSPFSSFSSFSLSRNSNAKFVICFCTRRRRIVLNNRHSLGASAKSATFPGIAVNTYFLTSCTTWIAKFVLPSNMLKYYSLNLKVWILILFLNSTVLISVTNSL